MWVQSFSNDFVPTMLCLLVLEMILIIIILGFVALLNLKVLDRPIKSYLKQKQKNKKNREIQNS